jgi:hypothetical protein
MDNLTRAYLAGYFDGEGCVTYMHSHGSVPSAVIYISQKARAPLDRIVAELGRGKVQPTTTGHNLRLTHRDDVLAFVRLIYPYVRQKRAQLRIAYGMALRTQVRSTAKISPLWRMRREEYALELARLNLEGRRNAKANRHGRQLLEVP